MDLQDRLEHAKSPNTFFEKYTSGKIELIVRLSMFFVKIDVSQVSVDYKS